eukprot:gene19618-23461_t
MLEGFEEGASLADAMGQGFLEALEREENEDALCSTADSLHEPAARTVVEDHAVSDGNIETNVEDTGEALLVSECCLAHPDLEGLDSPAEMFAIDPRKTGWGKYWLGHMPETSDVSHLPVPDVGGFVLRALEGPA